MKVLIALGHSGYEIDQELARNVPLLDLVVGGHSHTFLYPEHLEPTGDESQATTLERPWLTHQFRSWGR